jgi:hypothetical protein
MDGRTENIYSIFRDKLLLLECTYSAMLGPLPGPVLCTLGVIDFILNPYFGRQCWYHLIPGWLHSVHAEHTKLILTWFPWNCRVNGVCCLDPMPLQITTMCALHFVYNDKVSEISEVPKLLDRLFDCQYTPLGCTDLPWRFKQDNLCRAELLDDFWTIPCWNCDCQIWLGGNEVDMKVT